MKKFIFLAISISITLIGNSQTTDNNKIIELAKAYNKFMFRNEPPTEFITELMTKIPETMKVPASFIIQTITTNNLMLDKQYLTLPSEQDIKTIYIISKVNQNIIDETKFDNQKLVDSIKSKNIPKYELVDNYYRMLFTAVGNKIAPFNLSKVDFKLNEYNLADDTEKGIFFLRCMDLCRTEIWGYMNIVKPANTKKAYSYIKKYPLFNGLKYFQFTDLNFPDFNMKIEKDKGIQSYKSYFIDKYYYLLLYHLICLSKEGAKEKVLNDLLLGSILKDHNLYKYTKNKETLENLFKEQKDL